MSITPVVCTLCRDQKGGDTSAWTVAQMQSRTHSDVHNHTHNPKAHGSMERRVELLKGLEVKRLQNLVNKQREEMQAYHTAEQKALKKQKMERA